MIWNIDRDWLPVLMVARNELTFNLNSYCRFCMTEAFFKFSLHQKLSVYTKVVLADYTFHYKYCNFIFCHVCISRDMVIWTNNDNNAVDLIIIDVAACC